MKATVKSLFADSVSGLLHYPGEILAGDSAVDAVSRRVADEIKEAVVETKPKKKKKED